MKRDLGLGSGWNIIACGCSHNNYAATTIKLKSNFMNIGQKGKSEQLSCKENSQLFQRSYQNILYLK